VATLNALTITGSPAPVPTGEKVWVTDQQDGQLWPRRSPVAEVGHWEYPVAEPVPVPEPDPSTMGQWWAMGNLPYATASFGMEVDPATGLLYVFGGLTGSGNPSRANLNVYDPVAKAWHPLAPMPAPNRAFAATGFIDGKLYVAGGVDGVTGSSRNSLWCYDPVTDAWSIKAPLPAARAGYGQAHGVLGGKLYVCCGYDGAAKAETFCYNPATDSWSTKAPSTANIYPAVCAVKDKLYIVGGSSDGTNNSAVLREYDPATDTWTSKAGVPRADKSWAITSVDNRLYVLSGFGNQADFHEWNQDTNTWASKAGTYYPGQYAGAATVGGQYVTIAGGDGSRTAMMAYGVPAAPPPPPVSSDPVWTVDSSAGLQWP
jgi:N-acetylneuraminic acid mutarotase